jgi:ATP-dependent Clp protease protease subunit
VYVKNLFLIKYMPIGVPRIIYCWGEELPAQWTDIYNFIFRRRMVFLMQYLDDELCNQICGLLINIHMEDRSKELERKEMENSGLFKSATSQKQGNDSLKSNPIDNRSFGKTILGRKKERSIEDLMISEEDLAIDENYMLERNTLQKISLEWLNWNAQFFDYSDEPYLFYLAELLSKNDINSEGQLLYNLHSGMNEENSDTNLKYKEIYRSEFPRLMNMFQNLSKKEFNQSQSTNELKEEFFDSEIYSKKAFDIYSAFRLLSNFKPSTYESNITDLNKKNSSLEQFHTFQNSKSFKNSPLSKLIGNFSQKDLLQNLESEKNSMQWNSLTKTLTQRQLRKAYSEEKFFGQKNMLQPASYLTMQSSEEAYMEYRDYYRKQTERTFQDEESKKVFMIINSFGGSVGNGITVHDALQFIKAGSMTLALGVAASAASLALAGGTIGERYVSEGCHTMIHQPESSLSGQASDIWIDSQEIMKIRLDVAEIYSLSTYRPRHKILRDLDRDFYLTATETVYYGLADEIATNEVMHEIIEMTSKVWDYHESSQQRLLETRESATSGSETMTQN